MWALKIYLAGLAVLAGAIALNLLAGVLNLATWYSFLNALRDLGVSEALKSLNIVDVVFLLRLYPAALGACAYLVLRR